MCKTFSLNRRLQSESNKFASIDLRKGSSLTVLYYTHKKNKKKNVRSEIDT